MTDRMQLIEDLGIRLKDGASPSGLIRYVLSVLGDAVSYVDLGDVLQAAFHLPVVRLSRSSVAPERDHKGVILNKTLLLEIVQRRSDWDASDSPSMKSSWMDSLALRSPQEIGKEVRSSPFPELTNTSWSALSPEERESLCVQHISGIVNSQRLEVLSRLVERLQEKVNELEHHDSLAPSDPASSD